MDEIGLELIALTDAAALLGREYAWVWQKATAGKLGELTRNGGRILVRRSAVLAFAASPLPATSRT